jgi:type II secretory pathway predicted ATPase ExeA
LIIGVGIGGGGCVRSTRGWRGRRTRHRSGLGGGCAVGARKTVAIRAAVAALDASRHVPIYIADPAVGVRGLLHHIVAALGAVPSFYAATLVAQAGDALAAEQAERGRTPVLIIDEAHLLDHPQMEAVRARAAP